MDLKSLIAKMTAIEESEQVSMTSPSDQILTGGSVDECGDMPMPGAMAHSDPKQQDNVTMNVSMNGSGAGGIRDLMDILRNLEDGPGQQEPEEIELAFGETVPGSDATTAPSPEVFPMSAAIPTGDDLASKGVEAPKVNGGGNPMQESLISRLSEMYNEIKEQKTTEAAKWRDAEHKGKLYTQEPDDGEGDRHDYYRDSRPENDPGEKRSTFNRNKDTDKLHYPYGDYQVGKKAQVGDRAKKGLLTKNAISVVKNRIKGTSGDHPTPNLPK
jgi:hypothetical protein